MTEEERKKLMQQIGLGSALPNTTPVANMTPPNFSFAPTGGLATASPVSTSGFPGQTAIDNIGSDIGSIGTTYDPATAATYDPSKDAYGKAALENLGLEQGKEALQAKEDITNMGLRGAGTASNIMGELGTKQTREQALLGGQLTEQARQGALNEAQVTGFYGGQATLGRQTASVNAQLEKAGVDVQKMNLGIMSEKAKADILNSAAQLGLSRDQLESQIKQQETSAMINYMDMVQRGQISTDTLAQQLQISKDELENRMAIVQLNNGASMAQVAAQLKISENELKNRMDIAKMSQTSQDVQVNSQNKAIDEAQRQARQQYADAQHTAFQKQMGFSGY